MRVDSNSRGPARDAGGLRRPYDGELGLAGLGGAVGLLDGVYDVTHETGWVSVGVDHDTVSFDVFARTGTVFLTTVGYGIAALYGRAVKRVIDVYWKEELGLPEAMRVLEVENFGPFIVDGDRTSASLAALAIDKVNPNFAREYAKLPDYVLERIGQIDHSLAREVIAGRPQRK